ncbi:Reverse transcriptase domain-containing protein, partial [Aphis craccivora]
IMGPMFIPEPTTAIWEASACGFYEKWQFPNCIGSVDGKHFTIKCPDNSGSRNCCYLKKISVVLMATVDPEYKFICIDVGGYGRNSNGGILEKSTMDKWLESGTLKFQKVLHYLVKWKIRQWFLSKNVTTRKVHSSKSIKNTFPEDSNLKLIREDISALMKKFESVSISNTEFEKSIHFCSEKLDDYGKKNGSQELLANNIIISGIPYTKNENIDEIIKVTADIIKVNLHNNDIASSYWIKKVNKSGGKIIVKFNNKTLKESFQNGVKSLAISKRPLKSNQIHNSFPDKIKTDGDVPNKIQSIKDISTYDVENTLTHLKLHDLDSSL